MVNPERVRQWTEVLTALAQFALACFIIDQATGGAVRRRIESWWEDLHQVEAVSDVPQGYEGVMESARRRLKEPETDQ